MLQLVLGRSRRRPREDPRTTSRDDLSSVACYEIAQHVEMPVGVMRGLGSDRELVPPRVRGDGLGDRVVETVVECAKLSVVIDALRSIASSVIVL
ncbi:MAG TPA: hypothetical protein VF516_34135 [Kofleriaceae bacterium]